MPWRVALRLCRPYGFKTSGTVVAAGIASAAVTCASGYAQPVCAEQQKDGIVVLGGGVMGSAAAWQLAKRGQSVTVIDAGLPGSSWGESRIARLAYSDPLFIKIMQRAFELWDVLAAETGRTLLKRVPCLDIGDKQVLTLKELEQAYDSLGLHYERLSAAQVRHRFPQVSPLNSERAVLQADAGVLLAAECIGALEEAAEVNGATLISGEMAVKVNRRNRTVTTDAGKIYHYDQLVLCCGPWTNQVLSAAGLSLLPLVVSNEQNVYYEVNTDFTGPGYSADAGMPIVLEHPPVVPGIKDSGIYIIPDVGGISGVKVGYHRDGPLLRSNEFVVTSKATSSSALHCLPNSDKTFTSKRSDEVDPGSLAKCDSYISSRLPGLQKEHSIQLRCLYTLTTLPDEDFLIGRHPEDASVVVACGFQGEGFKFGAAIGEFVSDLVLRVPAPRMSIAVERFGLGRAL